jgi:hypothetical protein
MCVERNNHLAHERFIDFFLYVNCHVKSEEAPYATRMIIIIIVS